MEHENTASQNLKPSKVMPLAKAFFSTREEGQTKREKDYGRAKITRDRIIRSRRAPHRR